MSEIGCSEVAYSVLWRDLEDTRKELDAKEKECAELRKLLRQARPMVNSLCATRTAVVWTAELQLNASRVLRQIDAAMEKP
jgi:hypothetical protein